MFNWLKRLTKTAATTGPKIHIFDYQKDIMNSNADLRKEIEESFGPQGLGICIVRGIPNFVIKRFYLLKEAEKLGNLPEDRLQKLTRPDLHYSVGWSCGVEKFQGKNDYSKGSYYGNPLVNMESMENEHGILPNVWPDQDLPDLQKRFMEMGKLISEVGIGLSGHLDHFVESNCQTYEKGKIKNILSESVNVTGRLLHYFPQTEVKDTDGENWCGWHNDHSMLTGLTSAMYIHSDSGCSIVPPDCKNQGLFAKNRQSDVQKISIPEDCLAFQIGETLQIFSGGILEATPHCVRAGSFTGISRNTFAVFSGPKNDEILDVPKGMDPKDAESKGSHQIPPLEGRWVPGEQFQSFHKKTILAYNS